MGGIHRTGPSGVLSCYKLSIEETTYKPFRLWCWFGRGKPGLTSFPWREHTLAAVQAAALLGWPAGVLEIACMREITQKMS